MIARSAHYTALLRPIATLLLVAGLMLASGCASTGDVASRPCAENDDCPDGLCQEGACVPSTTDGDASGDVPSTADAGADDARSDAPSQDDASTSPDAVEDTNLSDGLIGPPDTGDDTDGDAAPSDVDDSDAGSDDDTRGGSLLGISDLTVTDDRHATAAPPSTYGGSANGFLDAGEVATLIPTITNPTDTTWPQIRIRVLSSTPTLTILSEAVPLGSIAPGESRAPTSGIRLRAAAGTADNTAAPISIIIEDATAGVLSRVPAQLFVRNVELSPGDVDYNDTSGNIDGIVDAGELVVFSFAVFNVGDAAFPLTSDASDPAPVPPGTQQFAISATLDATFASLTGSIPPFRATLEPGGTLPSRASFTLDVASDAAVGDSACIAITIEVRTADDALYRFVDDQCFAIGFAPGDLCSDDDGDGFGDGPLCDDPDCNDADDEIFPGATEICNGVDDDCDGEVDEAVGEPAFVDEDGDGFGTGEPSIYCPGDLPDGWSSEDGDCNDEDPAINPGATERCDGVDNDCDGAADESDVIWFRDADGDGYGDSRDTVTGCDPPSGYVSESGDCDDTDEDRHPGAEEICDGVDNDCDLLRDEETDFDIDEENCGSCGRRCGEFEECRAGDCFGFCVDIDDDGYFGTGACDRAGEDCNDGNDSIHPGATEVCDDGRDQDCDGSDAVCEVACDPVRQTCRSGAKCSLASGDRFLCTEDGEDGPGERCTGGSGLSDSCRAGSICLRRGSLVASTCFEMCDSDDDCSDPSSYCALNLLGDDEETVVQLCERLTTCDPIVQNCAASERCSSYFSDRGGVDFLCLTDGELAEGAACGDDIAAACGRGTSCVGSPEDGYFCRRFCSRSSGGPCPAGASCVGVRDWPDEYGACIP